MPPKKTVYCKKCNNTHERPVGRRCKRSGNDFTLSTSDQTISDSVESVQVSQPVTQPDPMTMVLQKLQDMEARQEQLWAKVNRIEADTPIVPTTSSPIRQRTQQFQTEGMVPSLDFLRSSKDIQTEVAARMRALDDINTYPGKPTNLKSGRFRSFDTQVQHYVQWPHEHVYVGAARKTVSYDELNPQQFALGFIKIIMRQPSSDLREAMLNYLSKLLQESIDFSWSSSRGAHAVVLQEIERGTVTWKDTDELDNIRKLYTQKVNTVEQPRQYASDLKKVVCSHYNAGKCIKSSDHQKDNILYRHICSHCFRVVRKAYNHPEPSCNRRNKIDGSD